jgi:hypothetical protein
VHKIVLRVAATQLRSQLSRRTAICALIACFQVFASGYLGQVPNSQSALILASPMISPQQRSHVVVHHEEKS